MTLTTTAQQLQVPGARLHYEVAGSGPVLALVGLPMTGDYFQALARELADSFTVVTYDPRGFGRSSIEDPEQDSTPETTADDVSRVLAAVTDQPALVFGTSGGAVTGLALATSHPGQVATLVAHEPPLIDLLDDAEELRRQTREVYDAYRSQGVGPAFGRFMRLVDPDAPAPDPSSAPPPPPSERAQADGERMLAHSLLPTSSYHPDVAALTGGPVRVLVGRGSASTSRQPARRGAEALAELLGQRVEEFPGGHVGFLPPEMGGNPAGFAAVLRQLLA